MVVPVVCVAVLAAGYLLKAQCLAGFDGRQYQTLCYNDLQPLFAQRGLASLAFPYVDGRLAGTRLIGGALEYPVLTGLFMWAIAQLASDVNSYLWMSALALAPFGVLTAYLLAGLSGWRALLWGAAPSLALYAFHNWELLVVAATVLGIRDWRAGRTRPAAAWFGVGAALKLYPLLFLAPLVLESLLQGKRRLAAQGILVGVGSVALINLPFALVAREGWLASFGFHARRSADFNSWWHWAFPSRPLGLSLPPVALSHLNLLSAGLVAVTLLVALYAGFLRHRRDGAFPFLQVCAAALAGFLLWNKVHSPQYALWLLPFFALTGVHVAWWAAYTLVDLLVYVGIFRWFYDVFYRHVDFTLAKRALLAGVWGRALLLAVLVGVFLKARNVTRATEPEATTTAQ